MKPYIKSIPLALLALFYISFNPAYAEPITEEEESSSGFFSIRTDSNFLPLENLELGTGYFSLAFGKQKKQHSFTLGGAVFDDGMFGIIGNYQYDFSTQSIRPGLELALFVGASRGDKETKPLNSDASLPITALYLAGGASGGAFVKVDISSKWSIIGRTGVRLKPLTVKNPKSLKDSFLVYLGVEARRFLF